MELFLQIIQLIPVISMVCSVIAALTPTPKDDVWVAKWYKIIDVFAINIGRAKE